MQSRHAFMRAILEQFGATAIVSSVENLTECLMHETEYFVVRSDDAWKIKFREQFFGPYKSRNEALLFAIDAAQATGRREHSAEVLVEDIPDHFVTTWRYGDPVHPPLA